MTVGELYNQGLEKLKRNNIDDYRFDCDCLFLKFTHCSKVQRIAHSNDTVPEDRQNDFLAAVDRRINSEPLQYILGSWEFMGLDFSVGEGVLIPRPETEMLVERASEFIKKNQCKIVFDLCAGSGAVGLSVAKLNPECKVYLFEKYDGALKYLKKNLKSLCLENAVIVKSDIFDGLQNEFAKPDIILSNPPYINSSDIKSLQSEVHFEPLTALDGGDDGLDFYRCIRKKWIKHINIGGMLLMECGDGQSEDIASIFDDISRKIEVLYDFNDVDRVVKIIV